MSICEKRDGGERTLNDGTRYNKYKFIYCGEVPYYFSALKIRLDPGPVKMAATTIKAAGLQGGNTLPVTLLGYLLE